MAIQMKKKGQLKDNCIVGTVMTNSGAEKTLKDNGISLLRTAVGDKHVLAALLSRDLSLGGEASGHIILTEYNRFVSISKT